MLKLSLKPTGQSSANPYKTNAPWWTRDDAGAYRLGAGGTANWVVRKWTQFLDAVAGTFVARLYFKLDCIIRLRPDLKAKSW